jgi:hypothetical protein
MVLFGRLSIIFFSFYQNGTSFFSLLFQEFFVPGYILFEILAIIGIVVHVEQMVFIGDFVHLLLDELCEVAIGLSLRLCSML